MMEAPAGHKQSMIDLIEWARAHGFVLNEHHKRTAEALGVDTAGVTFSGRIPTHPNRPTSTPNGDR